MFEAFAIDVLLCAENVKAAASLLGLSWDAAHEIMKRVVERGLPVRKLDGICNVLVDEKSFGEGQDYVSVMTDSEASRVIEVALRRTEKSADIFWNSLNAKQKKSKLAAVSIDMWQSFENSIATDAPKGEILFPEFE